MALVDAVALRTHRPIGLLFIDNRAVRGFKVRIRFGFGQPVSLCALTLKERPDWLAFGQRVEVWLGYDGELRRRFTGFVENEGRSAWPHSKTITAAGYMRFAERKSTVEVVYSSQSARAIIADLLSRAGIPYTSIYGDDTTLGTIQDVVLKVGDTYLSLIQQIDAPWLCRTFDWLPDGTVRRQQITSLPTAAPKWTYTYPGNVLSISNPLTVRGIRNSVTVSGLDAVTSTWRADSPYIDPAHDEVHEVSSDLIETSGVASAVAALTMPTVNRMTRQVTIKVAGNPTLDPGDTISLDAPTVGIDAELLYLKELDEAFDEGGYFAQLTLEGGKGEAGYSTYAPIAGFTVQATQETFDAGGGITTYITVFCDGSSSSSPSNLPLTFAWANGTTADTGTASTYSFKLTAAEYAAGCAVTLTTTDAQGSDTATRDVAVGAGAIQVRDLYVALETDAASTPNGGDTWNTSTVNATCTPPDAARTHSYFGVGMALYYTADHLASAPTSVHTFPAAINSIWIHEIDEKKVVVGLASGAIYRTTNANLLGSATWTLYATRAAAVNWVVWTWDNALVDLSGTTVRRNGAAWWTLAAGYTAKRLALSFAGHFAAGDNGSTACVKRDNGTTLTWPSGYAPVRCGGLAHHLTQDVLYAADENGYFYRKAAGSSAFAYVSTIGGGECYHLRIDNTNLLVLYAACNSGLYKSYNGGAVWYLMRAGKSLMVGEGSQPWGAIETTTVLSAAGVGKVFRLGAEPTGWRDLAFDDSSWAASIASTYDYPPAWTIPSGSGIVCETDGNRPNYEIWLLRHEFTLPSGTISSATLKINSDNHAEGVWINNVFVYSNNADSVTPYQTVTVPAASLRSSAINVLAIKIHNGFAPPGHPNPSMTAYRLDVI
jgi:hypothetical protein